VQTANYGWLGEAVILRKFARVRIPVCYRLTMCLSPWSYVTAVDYAACSSQSLFYVLLKCRVGSYSYLSYGPTGMPHWLLFQCPVSQCSYLPVVTSFIFLLYEIWAVSGNMATVTSDRTFTITQTLPFVNNVWINWGCEISGFFLWGGRCLIFWELCWLTTFRGHLLVPLLKMGW